MNLRDDISTGIEFHSRTLRRLCEDREWMSALALVDSAADTEGAADEVLVLRALLREIVGDFEGALGDLSRTRLVQVDLLRARVLSRVGCGDAARDLVLNFQPPPGLLAHRDAGGFPYAMGVAGRRTDLALLGMTRLDDWGGVGWLSREWVRGTIAEQLMTLGAYGDCLEFLDAAFADDAWAPALVHICKQLHDISALPPPSPALASTALSQSLSGIRGWLSVDEATVLHELAATVPCHDAIVELGSYYGRSAISIASAVAPSHQAGVHLVDPHEGLEGYGASDSLGGLRTNLAKLGLLDRVQIHRARSTAIAAEWNGPQVGLLFIDAQHDVASVRADLESWTPMLAPGAIVAFHDANQPGPCQVLCDVLRGPSALRPVGCRDSLFVMRCCSPRLGLGELAWTTLLEHNGRSFRNWLDLDGERVRHQLWQALGAVEALEKA